MVAPSTDYGLPQGQVFPTTLLDSLYPYFALQGNTALQLALAQYGSRDTQAQLNAQLQGDAMRANATTAAAGIGAGASAYGAQVSALAQLAATNADAATRVLIAAGGDKNAANRLAAELMMQAGLANQATTMELGRRGGSGDLRENFGRMLALSGQGAMPGAFSAMNGLPSPYVTAPSVNYSDYGAAPQASMNLPSYNPGAAPSFSAPNVTVPNMDLGALYGSIFSGLGGLAGSGLGAGVNQGSASGVLPGPVNPFPRPTPEGPWGLGGQPPASAAGAMQYLQSGGSPQDAESILRQLAGLSGMASGGTLRPGEGALVGERGPEVLMRDLYGNDKIIPIKGGYADGGTVWSPSPAPAWQVGDPVQEAPAGLYQGGPVTGAPRSTAGPVTDPLGGPGGLGGLPISLPAVKPIKRNQYGYNIESPLQKFMRRKAAAAASKAEAEAVLAAPDPTPTPTDIAASTTPSYDAGLPGIGAPLPATEPGQLTPGGPKLTDLPFYQALMSGAAGPAWNANIQRPTAPELGVTAGVPLPFESSNVYQRSDPIQRQAMSQFWQYLGIPPEMQQFWLNQSTPGYRANQPQALGF